jgi:hypothetical protein
MHVDRQNISIAVAGFAMLLGIFAELSVLNQCSFLQTLCFPLGLLGLVLIFLFFVSSLFAPDKVTLS